MEKMRGSIINELPKTVVSEKKEQIQQDTGAIFGKAFNNRLGKVLNPTVNSFNFFSNIIGIMANF